MQIDRNMQMPTDPSVVGIHEVAIGDTFLRGNTPCMRLGNFPAGTGIDHPYVELESGNVAGAPPGTTVTRAHYHAKLEGCCGE